MRQAARSVEVAECAVRWRDAGVVGFDIAGPEAGYRPTRHLDAFDYVRRENFHITIHAGESFGLPSIWEALQFCGAERLGHGVRIVDDITVRDDGSVELGRLAAFVRDRRVPLEMCPTSNVHTGAAARSREHPIDLLRRLRFRVTRQHRQPADERRLDVVEFAALDEAFGIGLGEMEWLTINAMKSAFAPFDERLRLINEVVKPGYARLRAESRVVVVRSEALGARAQADPEGHPRGHAAHPQDRSRLRPQRPRGLHRAAALPLSPAPRQRRVGRAHARSLGPRHHRLRPDRARCRDRDLRGVGTPLRAAIATTRGSSTGSTCRRRPGRRSTRVVTRTSAGSRTASCRSGSTSCCAPVDPRRSRARPGGPAAGLRASPSEYDDLDVFL